jgi:3-deoxy-manno-octulosonate cytidylyltransferase (CMP-KDO synthetase)
MSELSELVTQCHVWRTQGLRIVFTNGCYDVLHVGHVQLLQKARSYGDVLIVGINSDDSVRRLKGPSRPVNPQEARSTVLAALSCVDAVIVFDEDTPVETIEVLRPDIHVKGGDYRPDDLPEAATVRSYGGEIRIVPLVAGFSTTTTLKKLTSTAVNTTPTASPGQALSSTESAARAVIIIPARWGSTRFPGKPLAILGDRPVIAHVVASALQTTAEKPILVATDDSRIGEVIRTQFDEADVAVVMTSVDCATGTDRLAEAVTAKLGSGSLDNVIVINIQGDEPFINPRHVDLLIQAMRTDPTLDMATLVTPLHDEAQIADPNVVKAVAAFNGDALYFSRYPIPFERDATQEATRLRHLGVYAYRASWLIDMAALPPSTLEKKEKLEQLRALENGRRIKLVNIDDVINIAIDTPEDLAYARKFLAQKS